MNDPFWIQNFGHIRQVPLGELVVALLKVSTRYDEVHRNQALRILHYMLELNDQDGEQRELCSVDHSQFTTFLCRFGPIRVAFGKATASFFSDHRGCLVSWFHGTISRKTAENRVRDLPHGSFLIRFSNQEPLDKFSLTHMKVKTLKHCLIYNVGEKGFSLTKDGSESYPSITDLIRVHEADRLSKPVKSDISNKFRQELEEAEEGMYANPYRLQATQTTGCFNKDPPPVVSNHSPPLLPPTPSETELARSRITRFETLELTLSEKFDSARALSISKETQCSAFDDLVNLASTIQTELRCDSEGIPQNSASGLEIVLVRRQSSCALLMLLLRTYIAAADLSTSLTNPDGSRPGSGAGGGGGNCSAPAVKLYIQALEVTQFLLENIPIDEFDQDEEPLGEPLRVSLTRRPTMKRVDPVLDQCKRLAAHIHLKLALLEVNPHIHFSAMMGSMSGSFESRLKECFVAITSIDPAIMDKLSSPFSLEEANVHLGHGRKLLKEGKIEESVLSFEQCLLHTRLCMLTTNTFDTLDSMGAAASVSWISELAAVEVKAIANTAQAKYKLKAYGCAILNHRSCLAHLENMTHCPDSVLDVKDNKLRILNAACLACKDAARYSDSIRLCKRQLSQVAKAENITKLSERLVDLEALSCPGGVEHSITPH